MNDITVLIGPTASGKSTIAMEWAHKSNMEIVSCDSMQVYRRMDIGTAKPSLQDRQLIPHHCIDIVDPDCDFSVAKYVECADAVIMGIIERGKQPLVVGGTIFFAKALCFRHNFLPTDSDIRRQLQDQLDMHGNQYMHAKLQSVDKESARTINVNDTKRLLRALEIYQVSGLPKSVLISMSPKPRYNCRMYCTHIERDMLYKTINARVDNMVSQGLFDEVRSLMQYKYCRSMQAIGYKEVIDFFENNLTYQDSINLIKQHSRNYAKRQLTFLRSFDNLTLISHSK